VDRVPPAHDEGGFFSIQGDLFLFFASQFFFPTLLGTYGADSSVSYGYDARDQIHNNPDTPPSPEDGTCPMICLTPQFLDNFPLGLPPRPLTFSKDGGSMVSFPRSRVG